MSVESPEVSIESPTASAPGFERALWVSVVILIAIYIALFVGGIRFFVYKTALLPVVLAYGLLVRQRAAFMADWLPLLSATLLFDAVRGAIFTAIDRGYHHFYVTYVITLEEMVFGVDALPHTVQAWLRSPLLDVLAVLVHASHFLFFLMFGLMLWQLRREHFRTFRRSMVLLMLFGLIGYAVIPTAPPWIAAFYKQIPELPHISREVYTHYVQELWGAFATNPVAAMPSLHAAFPFLCALIGWRAYGPRIGAMLMAYAFFVMVSVVYLGEHYGVDVLAGLIVAWLAFEAGRRMQPLNLSFRASVLASAGGIALMIALVQISRAIPNRLF